MASTRRDKRLAIGIVTQGLAKYLSSRWHFHKVDNEKIAICKAAKNGKLDMLMVVYDMSITNEGLLLRHMVGDETTISLADPDSFKKIAEFIELDHKRPRKLKDKTWTSTLYISNPTTLKKWRNFFK